MAAVREIMMARRGLPAKEHPLVAGDGAPQPRIVSYRADQSQALAADENIASLGRPAARTQKAAARPGPARVVAERSRSDGQLAAAGPGKPASRVNVSATSNAARSKIGEPPPAPTANRGKIPAYLKSRKQELSEIKAREEEERTRERVPEGLRRVSPEEQEESLEILRDRKTAAEKKYARLPLRCNTHRARQAKEALEEKIQAHDALLKAFSKPKVYVPVDVPPISREDDEEDDMPSPEGKPAAFDRPLGGAPWSGQAAPTKTHTMVLQPPGGVSSFKLH